MHIAVLMGGPSSERAVSLQSGKAVADGLRCAGFEVSEYELSDARLPDLSDDVEVVFAAMHGAFGEDGEVQQLLEERGLPYVGCDAAASRLVIDKHATKDKLTAAGLPVPPIRPPTRSPA